MQRSDEQKKTSLQTFPTQVPPSTNQSNEGRERRGGNGVSAKTNRKGFLEVNGEVLETLPNATFRVALENGHEMRVYLGGKMRMHRIMLIPGDRVKVEISPYDLSKGRVVYRY